MPVTESKVNYGRVIERSLLTISVIAGLGVVVTAIWIGFVHDYSALWTAARVSLRRPELLYDAQAITDLQGWIGGSGLRPWIYPPSTLLYLLPLSVLPFKLSLWVWGLASLGLYVFAAYSFAPFTKGTLAPAAAYFMVAHKTGALDWVLALASLWLLFAAGTTTSVIAMMFTLLVFWHAATKRTTAVEVV